MFPIFEKSEVFCRSACPAIAFGDGGLSRHSLLQQQCNYWKNIISPQWEQSIRKKCNRHRRTAGDFLVIKKTREISYGY